MAWFNKPITSWREFTDVVDHATTIIASPLASHFLYRGQADAGWSLEPSLARLLRGRSVTAALKAEQLAQQEFTRHAHLHLPEHIARSATEFLGWWALMQHYRAPTRLLDWSASPYVAAYFAVEDHDSKEGAIWAFGVRELQKRMDRKYGPAPLSGNLKDLFQNPASPPHIQPVRREVSTDRMIAQQGVFTICRQPLCDHGQPIEEVMSGAAPGMCMKIIIPSHLKPEFLRRLRAMNITANALFPGIDGVGRSVAELVRVAI